MAKKQETEGGALAVVDTSRFPALTPGSEIAEAMQANMTGEQIQEGDLTRVPTPAGGATQWVVPDLTGETSTDEIIGLLVYFAPRGVLWPSEEPSESMPLLISNDLLTAQRVGDDYGDIDPDELEKFRNADGTYDWQALPWNQWGSGKGGVGKRCKESRLLMVLREGDAFPLLIRCQPGSLKTVRPFIMKLPVPHWRAVVGLKLQRVKNKTGQVYSQIVPRYVGAISQEEGARIRQLYTDNLGRMVRGRMESDAEG